MRVEPVNQSASGLQCRSRADDRRSVSAVFQTAAPYLVQSFTALLDLYRAVLPVQHASLVSTVPALGMQFANDCDWIAAAIADRARAADDEVALTAAELRECALRVRMQQMVRSTGSKTPS